jgi:predicted KAP-like P-loop ATPase
MWSDNEADLDLLNITYLVSAVIDTVQNPNLLPITVGVFGDWGSGKSSILMMARKELEGEEDVLCLSFNGWLFEGYEDAKAALMGAILDGIREQRTLGPKAKELIGKLVKRVNWFSLMGMVSKHAATFAFGDPTIFATQMVGDLAGKGAGELAGNVVKDAPGVIREAKDEDLPEKESTRKSVRDFRADFESLLQETKIKTLVVFIDDLDRCLPDTVIETLEAVRLFLFTKGTAFVICADERLVEHAVERRFPEPLGVRSEIAQNYLEKLVQVPIRIPPMGPNEVRSYMNLLFGQLRLQERFTEVHNKVLEEGKDGTEDSVLDYEWFQKNVEELPQELAEDLALTERIGDTLAEMLSGNPRQVKRFLNALVLRMGMSEKRGVKLKQGILAKLMVLEYKKQETFRQLAELQSGQNGKPVELEILETRARQQKGDEQVDEASEPVSEKKGDEKGKSLPKEETPPPLNETFNAWLENSWLVDWLVSEPSLIEEDLRPYFYVSRDRIGSIAGPKLQLSPAAQDTLKKLTSASDAERMNGMQSARALSEADAISVLQALIDRARKAEEHTGEGAPVNVLLGYAGTRPELAVEAILAMGRIPDARLGSGVPSRLAGLKQHAPVARNAVNAQLQRWAESTNSVLAGAATNILKRG